MNVHLNSIFTILLLSRNVVTGKQLNVSVEIPKNVVSGSSVTLYSSFSLPLEEIYSIKWYHQNTEFYRYSPSENPPEKYFSFFPEINVDIAKSNATQVTLKNVSESLTGMYTCEVTAAETFTIGSDSSMLYVYDVALLSKPKIKVELRIFNGVDFPTILCSTIFIKEKNKFSNGIYVNNKPVRPDLVRYDEKTGYLRLNMDKTPWKNETNAMVSCRSNLPGIVGLNSSEICYNCLSSSDRRLISGSLISYLVLIIAISFLRLP